MVVYGCSRFTGVIYWSQGTRGGYSLDPCDQCHQGTNKTTNKDILRKHREPIHKLNKFLPLLALTSR